MIVRTKTLMVLHPEMVVELKLKGVDLLVFSHIYNMHNPPNNFKEENTSSFAESIGVSHEIVKKSLIKLVCKGHISNINGGYISNIVL